MNIKNDILKYGQPVEMYNVNPYTPFIFLSCYYLFSIKRNLYVFKLIYIDEIYIMALMEVNTDVLIIL